MRDTHLLRLLVFISIVASHQAVADARVTHTFVDGEIIDADELNKNFDDLGDALPPNDCNPGQTIKWSDGGGWECVDHNISPTNCSSGDHLVYDETNGWACYTALDCGAPPDGINTAPVMPGTNIAAGQHYQWQCLNGYETDDETVAVCDPSGALTAAPPTCYEITCGPWPEGVNTLPVFPPGDTASYLDVKQYQCLPGFTLYSSGVLVCGPDGLVGEVGECEMYLVP